MTKELPGGPDQIAEILPHRPPFLFVDEVLELKPGQRILAQREIRAKEPHFAGHFPGQPIMPGVLITEALAQTAGLLLALSAMAEEIESEPESKPDGQLFYLARADTKWTEPVGPGETLLLEAKHKKTLGVLHVFAVRAFTKRKDVARGTLTLARIRN